MVACCMAMQTTLFAIPQDQLDALVADPDSIHTLDSDHTFGTYISVTLTYFLTLAESSGGPMSEVLGGTDSVECERLENAYFFVVPSARVAELLDPLLSVDTDALRAKVLEADLEEVMDGELYEELEMASLFEAEEVATEVVRELERLKLFYKKTAEANHGIVMYTT